MIRSKIIFLYLLIATVVSAKDYDPIVDRKGVLPDYLISSEWLIHDAEFQDLVCQLPAEDMTSDTWSTDTYVPYSLRLGIEYSDWSYWGGSPLFGNDGKYTVLLHVGQKISDGDIWHGMDYLLPTQSPTTRLSMKSAW